METYEGIIRTPSDAIVLFEACRLGLLPRVCRRLSEKERQNIRSGSVFVWDEREAGMRRWTDGKSWSASRVSGSFLTYREMEGKRSGAGSSFNGPARSGRTPDASGRNSDEGDQGNNDESPEGYRYKPDGLMKQSFSITTSNGQHLHLISYFSRLSNAQVHLKQPTNDPALRHIKPPHGMYPESSVQESHNMPPVTRSPMPSAGAPLQQPKGPGYAKTFLPQQGHPQYSGTPHYAAPGYLPPQVAVNGYGPPVYGQPHPPPLPPQQTPLIPAYHPGPGPGPHPHHPALPASAVQTIMTPGLPKEVAPALYPYGSGEQQPNTYHAPSNPALIPPRHSTPPTDPGRTALHHRTSSAGSYQQAYYPSPHNAYNQLTPQPSISSHPSQNNSPSSTPPAVNLEPRSMMAPSPLSQHSPRNLHPEYTSSASRRSISPHRTPPISYPPQRIAAAPQLPQINPPTSAPLQSASSIPSIGALVNGADMRRNERSRSNSRSPGGGNHGPVEDGSSTPSQWPQNKMDFGEDRRALNVLNKAFRT